MKKLFSAAQRISNIIKMLCEIDCFAVDISSGTTVQPKFCNYCVREQTQVFESPKCIGIGTSAIYNAEKWGGKYEFLCPIGCGFVATSLSEGAEIAAGVLIGPFLLADDLDDVEHDVRSFFHGHESERMLSAVFELPSPGYQRVPYISDMAFMLSSYLSEREILDQRVMEISGKYQNGIHESIMRLKDDSKMQAYPIEIERMLRMYIVNGDRQGAQNALNDILGYIYFASGGSFAVMKARVIELTVVLSRAAIEGGASVSEVFGLNSNYLAEIGTIENFDKLNSWLYTVLMRFTNSVFKVDDTKHSDIIQRVMEYINNHLSDKISLNDISNYVNFSVSYLSRIFKEETGENISAYINRMRVEQAKVLLLNPKYSLLDIAAISGFEEQSYFNKVFKKLCGITPGKFREKYKKGV